MNTLKRALAGFLTLVLVVLGVGLTASPANAYVSSLIKVVVITNYIEASNAVIFHRQGDGTGVYVDWTGPDLSPGCNGATGSNPRWRDMEVWVQDGNSTSMIVMKHYSDTTLCSPTLQINQAGYDEGFVYVTVRATLKWASANVLYRCSWIWELYPSGNSGWYDGGCSYAGYGGG